MTLSVLSLSVLSLSSALCPLSSVCPLPVLSLSVVGLSSVSVLCPLFSVCPLSVLSQSVLTLSSVSVLCLLLSVVCRLSSGLWPWSVCLGGALPSVRSVYCDSDGCSGGGGFAINKRKDHNFCRATPKKLDSFPGRRAA